MIELCSASDWTRGAEISSQINIETVLEPKDDAYFSKQRIHTFGAAEGRLQLHAAVIVAESSGAGYYEMRLDSEGSMFVDRSTICTVYIDQGQKIEC